MAALEPFEPLGSRDAEVERGPRALLLPVHADRYAVAIERVRVVLEAPVVTRVPGVAAAVLGVVNVRGEVLPVLDTGLALGVGALRGAPFAAVVDTEHGRVALAAGAVPRSVALGDAAAATELPAGTAVRRVGEDGVATVVDVDALAALAGAPA